MIITPTLPIADEVFGKQHGEFDVVFTQQIQQRLLTFNLREFAEVSVTPEKVEGVSRPVDPAALMLVPGITSR